MVSKRNKKHMTFELFCIPYNEEWLLRKMVEWYRKKLEGHELIINVYDNESTDNTVEVAKELGCNVFHFDTGGKLKNQEYIDLCNSVWKNSTADYVIVICTDEFIDIDPEQIKDSTILQCIGYDMVGDGTIEIENLTEGIRNTYQDKSCIFSPRHIKEINYLHGAHQCSPTGTVINSTYRPLLCHMCMISKEWILFRYQRGRTRLSDYDVQRQWGIHYFVSDEEILQQHKDAWEKRIKVRDL
jgi:glycosyltransferase involved in cell wall biosynthesis